MLRKNAHARRCADAHISSLGYPWSESCRHKKLSGKCELSAFLTSQTADFQGCATRAFHMYIERNCYISVYVLFSRMKRIHQDSQNAKNKI